MTVDELASRITMAELDEWIRLQGIERDEQERRERVARVEQQARANRRG